MKQKEILKEKSSFTREDTQAMKGIAIILMFVHHLFCFPERLAEGVSYTPMFWVGPVTAEVYLGNFGRICPFMFAFLGGLGTYIGCSRFQGKELDSRIWKRIKGLYISFWQVFAIFIPLCLLLKVDGITSDLNSLILNISGVNPFFNGEWWFFTPYVLLMAAFPPLLAVSRKMTSFCSELMAIFVVYVGIAVMFPAMAGYAWADALMKSPMFQLFLKMLRLLPTFWLGCLFAKHDILGQVKDVCSGSLLAALAGAMGALMILYMRNRLAEKYDFLFAVLLILVMTLIFSNRIGRWIQKGLVMIGKESTVCWLVHSFYCYHLCQKFVFAPKYSLLILALLLVMCCLTSKAMKWLYDGLGYLYQKCAWIYTLN